MIRQRLHLNKAKNALCLTSGHTQLPGRGVANAGSFAYLSGITTSERFETATAYTAKRLAVMAQRLQLINILPN